MNFRDCAVGMCAFIRPQPPLNRATSLWGLAGIEQADSSQCPAAAEGAPVDHKAWRANCNVQRPGSFFVGDNGADRMFGFRPWDMMQQP